MSKTAQTVERKTEKMLLMVLGPTGGVPLARQGQWRDLDAGRNGQVWEHRQDGWYRRDKNGNWSRSQGE